MAHPPNQCGDDKPEEYALQFQSCATTACASLSQHLLLSDLVQVVEQLQTALEQLSHRPSTHPQKTYPSPDPEILHLLNDADKRRRIALLALSQHTEAP